MAYNSYFPTGYQPVYYNHPAGYQPAQQPASNSIQWVQGENGAKSYIVPQGQSILLMDSESSRFYIKSADNTGMPLPLRIFEYNEIKQEAGESTQTKKSFDAAAFVARSEYDEKISELEKKIEKLTKEKKNAESTV